MPTHDLTLGDVVVKSFRSYGRGEPGREWRGLSLLERYAPDLAPRPLAADLSAAPPTVTMSRVPGTPLTGCLDATTTAGIGAALDRLHAAVPRSEIAALPLCISHPHDGLPELRATFDRPENLPEDPVIRAAVAAALRWLRTADADRAADPDLGTPVFGRQDHNLPNFLLDGTAVRLVDFEDSGRSDADTELAALVEHQAALSTPDERWAPLLAGGGTRLRDARRYYGAWWVLLMLPGQRGHDRNPAPVRRARAERTLALLD